MKNSAYMRHVIHQIPPAYSSYIYYWWMNQFLSFLFTLKWPRFEDWRKRMRKGLFFYMCAFIEITSKITCEWFMLICCERKCESITSISVVFNGSKRVLGHNQRSSITRLLVFVIKTWNWKGFWGKWMSLGKNSWGIDLNSFFSIWSCV